MSSQGKAGTAGTTRTCLSLQKALGAPLCVCSCFSPQICLAAFPFAFGFGAKSQPCVNALPQPSVRAVVDASSSLWNLGSRCQQGSREWSGMVTQTSSRYATISQSHFSIGCGQTRPTEKSYMAVGCMPGSSLEQGHQGYFSVFRESL